MGNATAATKQNFRQNTALVVGTHGIFLTLSQKKHQHPLQSPTRHDQRKKRHDKFECVKLMQFYCDLSWQSVGVRADPLAHSRIEAMERVLRQTLDLDPDPSCIQVSAVRRVQAGEDLFTNSVHLRPTTARMLVHSDRSHIHTHTHIHRHTHRHTHTQTHIHVRCQQDVLISAFCPAT
jgi:hypothetical protein